MRSTRCLLRNRFPIVVRRIPPLRAPSRLFSQRTPMTTEPKQQKRAELPTWHGPKGEAPLKVFNSLTLQKEPFVTTKPRKAGFYICGPTVYDAAHLGHARAYVTFDILRRILSDYFGFDVTYVMNVTDIDDKIILRARRNYLVAQYEKALQADLAKASTAAAKLDTLQKVASFASAGFAASLQKFAEKLSALADKLEKTAQQSKKDDVKEEIDETQFKRGKVVEEQSLFRGALFVLSKQGGGELKAIAPASELVEFKPAERKAGDDDDVQPITLPPIPQSASEQLSLLVSLGHTPLGDQLDAAKGKEITDWSIFEAHSKRYEREFREDMASLGIREPDMMTRVVEYVPAIIKFTQKIIENGFAYEGKADEAGGARSVYFDTVAFSKSHSYGKLAPWSVGNSKLADEGEGALSAGSEREKKNANDFALWKRSKPGEPRWASPWGLGRPGWHIECSAMASDLLGTNFDVHAGGEDLKFPHHDNELAQSEAYSGNQQWVNHFWHAGHLHIEGRKMSKSLKNFITIREALEKYTARQIRILFLLQAWDKPMNFSKAGITDAKTKEATFKEFFLNIATAIRTKGDLSDSSLFYSADDRALEAAFTAAQDGVHAALSDNFNYPQAMRVLLDFVSDVNKYRTAAKADVKPLLLQKSAKFVDKILRVFGVIVDTEPGAGLSVAASGAGSAEQSAQLAKVLDSLSRFRDTVREGGQKKQPPQFFLQKCDELRDDVLPAIGVRLEDVANGPSVWKLDDPAALLRQKEEKRRAAAGEALKSAKNKLALRQKALEKWQAASVDPQAQFAKHRFDADGNPTVDEQGKELTKSAAKNIKKAYDKQVAAFKEYSEKLAKEPEFFNALKAEVAALNSQIAELEAGGAAPPSAAAPAPAANRSTGDKADNKSGAESKDSGKGGKESKRDQGKSNGSAPAAAAAVAAVAGAASDDKAGKDSKKQQKGDAGGKKDKQQQQPKKAQSQKSDAAANGKGNASSAASSSSSSSAESIAPWRSAWEPLSNYPHPLVYYRG